MFLPGLVTVSMYAPLSFAPIILPSSIYNWRPRLIGPQKHQVKSRHARSCTLLVPCARKFEEFGLVVLEARAAAGRGKRFARNSVHSHRTISFAFNLVLSRYCNRVSR